MPSRLAEKLVGEAALAAVAPLAQTPELAVLQPLQHRLFVGVVHADDLKLAGAACGDLLAVGQADPLALSGLGPQGTLAVVYGTTEGEGNLAGADKNQAVDDLLIGRQLAALIDRPLLPFSSLPPMRPSIPQLSLKKPLTW